MTEPISKTSPSISKADDAGEDQPVIPVKGNARRWRKILSHAWVCSAWTLVCLLALYLWGMVYYNGPFKQAGVANLLLACLWIMIGWVLWSRAGQWKQKLLAFIVAIALVIIPWSYIRPSNDRAWIPGHARVGHTEAAGDRLIIHNVRNFDYGEDGEVTERWEKRIVHISKLRGVDLFHDAFMGDLMGHPILSFDFGPEGRICLSVEARSEVGEGFSPFGGLYKMFELQYLFATEEDCIRLRTNIRKEPVYLHQINVPLEEIRDMFLSSVRIQNELADKPRFYNVIHANCTTSLRGQRPEDKRGSWDIRLLFNGLLDQYLYERGRLHTHELGFDELRKRAKINDAAVKSNDALGFSRRIREGRFEMD